MSAPEPSKASPSLKMHVSKKEVGVVIGGGTDIVYQLAQCCCPLPGDNIVGYISRKRGMIIHRQDCRILQHGLEIHPERHIVASWPKTYEDAPKTLRAHLNIQVTDIVVLSELAPLLCLQGVHCYHIKPNVLGTTINVLIGFESQEKWQDFRKKMENIEGVKSFHRKI